MEIDTGKHELSRLSLEIGKTKDMETIISTTEKSVGVVSCGGNSCNEQMLVKSESDEFCDQVISVDKQMEYNDCDASEVGTYFCCVKEESTYDIKTGTEEYRVNCVWLEMGKREDFDQMTVKSDDLSNKSVIDDDHEEHNVTDAEEYGNDIKEENVEDVLTDIKSCSEGLSTESISKDDPESSGAHLFTCDLCGFIAENKETLKAHIQRKHKMPVDWYQCQFCQFKTKSKGSLKSHLKVMHYLNIKWHHCQHCEFKTLYKYSLEAHLASKHKIIDENCKLQQCQFCDYTAVHTIRLKQHLRRKHNQTDVWHHCQHCKFETKYKYSLEAHLAYKHKIIDEKSRLQQCQFCDYNSVLTSRVKRHVRKIHAQKVDQQCLFKTENEDTLVRHVMRKYESPSESEGAEECEPYQCMLCNFETDRQSFLTRHFFNVHHKNTESYKCLLCDFKAEDKFRVTVHFKKTHPLNTFNLKEHLQTQLDQKQWHQCQQCLYKTKNEDTLARHVRCKHKSPGESKDTENFEHYQCRLCEFKTDKQHVLTRHFANVHEKNTELFKCLLCDFKTEDKFRVTLHFKKNHPVSAD